MKTLHKLLAVLVLGAMVAPAVEARGKWTEEQKAEAKAKRDAMSPEEKQAAKEKRAAARAKNGGRCTGGKKHKRTRS